MRGSFAGSTRSAHLQPMSEVVAHVVAAERRMANGSRRSSPTLFSAAAVPSEAMLDGQEHAMAPVEGLDDQRHSRRRGGRRTGSPRSARPGIFPLRRDRRALTGRGGEARVGVGGGRPPPGDHGWPFQSVRFSGGCAVRPSHQTSPSAVSATLVKMQLATSVAMALVLVA